MSNISSNLITDLVLDIIRDTDLFITDIKVKKDNTIYVFLDGDKGVTVEQCIQISKHIEKTLDRNKIDFELNVSSHGLGTPLKLYRQYKNAIGKQLTVKLNDGTKISGKLLNATEEEIELEIKETKKTPIYTHKIQITDVKEAKIEVVF